MNLLKRLFFDKSGEPYLFMGARQSPSTPPAYIFEGDSHFTAPDIPLPQRNVPDRKPSKASKNATSDTIIEGEK
jgi:hypothetical protein